MKQQETVETLRSFGSSALLDADAALPRLLAAGRADSPSAAVNRRLTRSRHLWTREDGFTMAGARR
ncbi:hypothetical protein GEOBRER4_n0663 [Citrifermentans bremense]|uniref:Uncharacterized protein n=1 Tax=Citrifermentans bremense TaxID=60035 RepID=A0A6S6LWV2_9BACT|nr:hypothetical protein [Citrifermentans bremense]BCG45889.1 hypothetical protein GEOBRER4_n0663 [Citrifermentans bremense]